LGNSNSVDIGTLSQSVRAGWSYFTTDFSREVMGQRSRRLSDLATRAMFISFDIRPLKQLGFRAGYRHERTWLTRHNDTLTDFFGPAPFFVPLGTRFVTGTPIETVWRNDAMELGTIVEVSPETHLFANYERTFRTPNVDELALATPNLRPQDGEHIDLGFRTVIGDAAELSGTLFKTRMQDEIFFGIDPTTGMQVNRNFDDGTRRRGIELDVKLYLHEKLYVWANYTQLIARFNTRDTTIPLVPHRMFNLGAEFDLTTHLLAAVSVRWVSSRFDGNDEKNTAFPELPSYRVFDAKLRYQRKAWSVSAGINNVFNELYSTLAFSRTVYPMPQRNAHVSAAITF
jgi:iron complex outermembrane receptor protein